MSKKIVVIAIICVVLVWLFFGGFVGILATVIAAIAFGIGRLVNRRNRQREGQGLEVHK